MEKSYKPVVLCVLDGFGVSAEEKGNPVAEAKTPNLDFLEANYPFTTLQASGVAVGLPWGEAGNSEVGHLTMGAGRVIYNHLPRIIHAIHDRSFFKNEAFLKAAEHVKTHGSRLHLLGLVSSGSVHSYASHLHALLQFVEEAGIREAFLHVIMDGKDAPPKEGEKFLASLEETMSKEFPHTKIASIIGRFYAMDRDENWDRIARAYALYTAGDGIHVRGSISGYMRASYDQGITDEFIEPACFLGGDGMPRGVIRENDAVIIFNFREDSVREITHALADTVFDRFPRTLVPGLVAVTMTEYEKGLNAAAAFPTIDIEHPLGRVISQAGNSQLRIAETEKYAHVTYFFNGGNEKPFPGEERVLVASPEITHFDEAPEMKATEIAERVVKSLARYDFILVNFANTDMVGHSGNFDAAVRAVEAVDGAIGKLYPAVLGKNGVLLVTGDHGNVEAKRDRITGERLTEHSLNPVPFILVGSDFAYVTPLDSQAIQAKKREAGGILTDIAPTVLQFLGLAKPAEMTGTSLLATLAR